MSEKPLKVFAGIADSNQNMGSRLDIEAGGRRASLREERGIVLVLNGLFLAVLIAAGGFAVDLGNWYLNAGRLQHGADAAALAGSVFLPNDMAAARMRAEHTLVSNGIDPATAEISQSPGHPTQLLVSVRKTVRNNFTSLLGYDHITLDRSATGEYRPYVPMGSPSNVLGVEAYGTDSWEKATQIGRQSKYWLNVVGGSTNKASGDRYSGGSCASGTDRCTVGRPIPTGNSDFSADGQYYVVRVPAGVSGRLQIQAFDAGFANVGDACTNNLNNANNYSPTRFPNLYASGNTVAACTGDNTGGSGGPPNVTYRLYTPEDAVGGSQPISGGTCNPVTYNGYDGPIVDKVRPGSTYDATFTGWFRKWSPICTLDIGTQYEPGDYILRVSTNLGSNGLNRFALRAAIINSNGSPNTNQTARISLFAKGRLVVYAKENTGNVTFYLARIYSGSAGQDMTLTLFDIGDAAGGANLSVLPPDDATSNGRSMSAFGGCAYTQPGSNTFIPTGTGCGISNMTSGTYNGRIVNVRVPIPIGYRCNDASSEGCWVRLRLTYGAGAVQDTTSWEVSLNGEPLHLISNQ